MEVIDFGPSEEPAACLRLTAYNSAARINSRETEIPVFASQKLGSLGREPMHRIWNICVGPAIILPIWAAPLPAGPAIADEKVEHRTTEATEEPAPVRDGDRDADTDYR